MMIVRPDIYGIINEDVQQAKSILRKLNIPETDSTYVEIKRLLTSENKLGYLGKFTQWLYRDHEPLNKVLDTYEELINFLNNGGKLPNIQTFDTVEDLYDFIHQTTSSTKLNQILNSIPSRTRENVTPKLKELLEVNIKYSDELIDFFSKAGGRYNKYSQRYTLPKEFKTYADWFYDTVEGLIKNLQGGYNLEAMKKKFKQVDANVEIILERSDLLIVRPMDFPTSKAIGSERLCICQSESYWKGYVTLFNAQYFAYDFTKPVSDKKSLIAATITADGKIKEIQYKNNDGTARAVFTNNDGNKKITPETEEILNYMQPVKPEEIIVEVEKRIKNFQKELVKSDDNVKIYNILNANSIKEILSSGFNITAAQSIFFNFYLVLDKRNKGFNQILGVKVPRDENIEIINATGQKLQKQDLNLDVLSNLNPVLAGEVVGKIEKRISPMKKTIIKSTPDYKIYLFENGNDISEILQTMRVSKNEEIFYNFYLILDDSVDNFNQVIAVKIGQKGEMTILNGEGKELDKSYLNKFE